jgi:heme-degrading monooxygenase HmoA
MLHKPTSLIMIASTPNPSYYAVIFTSILDHPDPEYVKLNHFLIKEAQKLDGFLGEESARNEYGLSVSYWRDLDSIAQWRTNADHQWAKEKGKKEFYKEYKIRIARVQRDNYFKKPNPTSAHL